jgi:hypothetical protein
MYFRILGLVVALVLAAGVLAPAPCTAFAKGRKVAKTAASKKTTKKSNKTTKSAKRSNDRASARAGKRSKNAGSDRISRRAGRPERRPAQKVIERQSVAKTPVRDDRDRDDVEELRSDEPAPPRPANRLVAEIAPGRVFEIQNALIKAGAFAGPASGVYDQATFEAMTSFQSRRGFGATGMPTAEALKALGVRKNSGLGISTPAGVLQSTAPSAAATPSYVQSPPPNR